MCMFISGFSEGLRVIHHMLDLISMLKQKLPYTVVLLNSNIITGSVVMGESPIGEQIKGQICQVHELDPAMFQLYSVDQYGEKEVEIIDEELVSHLAKHKIEALELRQKVPSAVETEEIRKRRATDPDNSITFEEESRIGGDEKQFMQNEPENTPYVYGQVKICRFFKCFSYEMFLELNPEISVLNLYTQKKKCPKRPSRTVPILQIQKIVRLKDSPCLSRMSYMKLILPDDTIAMCFYEKDVCMQWMKYIKQAIIYAKYLEERMDMVEEHEVRETFRKTNNSRVELVDSLNQSSMRSSQRSHKSSKSKSQLSSESVEEGQDVFVNQKKQIVLLDDFEIDKKIGSGSFGYVFLAKHKPSGRLVALKQLSKNELVQKRQLRYALTELQILKETNHPFILKLYYAFQTKDYLYMALNYCPHGTLKGLIQENGKLTVEDSLIYIAELILAVEYLHELDIIYRDLKPQNILIGNDYHLLLSDFGLSKTNVSVKDVTDSFCGSPMYLSPQMLTRNSATHMSDIYGIGAVFYEMIHGHPLYEADHIGEVFELIKTAKPEIDEDLPEQVKDFLIRTLQKNPQKRLKRISDHPLFDNINWRNVELKKYHPSVQFVKEGSSLQWVQIDYKIDEDYNHINYLENRVEGWLFSTNTSGDDR